MWLCWPENPSGRRAVLSLRKQRNLYRPKHSCWPNRAPGGSKAGTARCRLHPKAPVRKVSSTRRPGLADKSYHASATISWPSVLPPRSFFHSSAAIAGGSSTITYISVSQWVPALVSPGSRQAIEGPETQYVEWDWTYMGQDTWGAQCPQSWCWAKVAAISVLTEPKHFFFQASCKGHYKGRGTVVLLLNITLMKVCMQAEKMTHPFSPFPKSFLLLSSYNHRITESQNGRGWKGPLWVI